MRADQIQELVLLARSMVVVRHSCGTSEIKDRKTHVGLRVWFLACEISDRETHVGAEVVARGVRIAR